jgi:NAD(P)-dependent dehydrogenase (short-subunit alcohol dehydrogenase family)
MKVDGLRVVITGASRGLGEGLARELAAGGARLVLVARGRERLEAVTAAIRAGGGEAHAFAADVADRDAVHPLAGTAQALLGGIDVLVHNASALGPSPLRLWQDTADEDLERALAVNLVGPFRLTRAIAGSMALAGRGIVVHVSSDAAVSSYPGWGAYSVSKAAHDHLVRTWAAELEGTGVRFVAVDPGDMATDLHREASPGDDPASLLDPREVAGRFVDLLAGIETVPSGSRLVLGAWRPPRWTWGTRPQGAVADRKARAG